MILRPWMYTILSIAYVIVGILMAPSLWITAVFIGYGAVCLSMCYYSIKHHQKSVNALLSDSHNQKE